ncbi:MAG: transcription antitermination protein [Haloferacaceae archaeon]
MDGQSLADRLRDERETELSRLGSSKAMYAITDGDMDAAGVRAAAADETHLAARTFDAWAADEDHAHAAEVFTDAAERAHDAHEKVVPEDHNHADSLPVYSHLDGVEGTVDRAAALLARTLVAGKTFEQMVGFFVGNADPSTADTFRDLVSDVEAEREEAIDLLDDLEGDPDEAYEAADAVVAVAYEDYVETLESMGIKPKNVC